MFYTSNIAPISSIEKKKISGRKITWIFQNLLWFTYLWNGCLITFKKCVLETE